MTEHAPSTHGDDLRLRPLEEADFDRLIALFDAVAAERRWIGTEPGFDRDRSLRRDAGFERRAYFRNSAMRQTGEV